MKKQSIRISVTIPEDLYLDFVERSRLAGLSISRIAYLQMKSRKPPIIVPLAFMEELQRIESMQKHLETGKPFSNEVRGELEYDISLLRKNVDLYSGFIAVKGGKRHAKR